MEKTVRDYLTDALKDLDEEQLNKFKQKLSELHLHFPSFPRRRLQEAHSRDVSDLLFHYYRFDALEVAAQLLAEISLKDEAQELRDVARRWPREPISAKPHFVDKHRAELIQRIYSVELVLDLFHGGILDDEKYKRIVSQKTNQDKMRELYRLVPSWGRFWKDQLYEALKATNNFVIQDILSREEQVQGGGASKGHPDHNVGTKDSCLGPQEPISKELHFIDKHRAELIRKTLMVEPVLDLLRGSILDDEQHKRIISRETSQDKMRELYRLIPSWDCSWKDQLYEALKAKNSFLIKRILSREGQVRQGGATSGHPVHNMGTLASCPEEHFIEEESDKEKTELLYKEHFIEKHQEELIHRVSGVDTILRQLPVPRSLIERCSDQQKMEQLYRLVPKWSRKEKDHLYMVLKKTNGPLVAELEEEHFIEKHQEELIRCATGVDVVLSFALSNQLITEEQKQEIKGSPQEQMRKLYVLVGAWMTAGKEKLKGALRETNPRLVAQLAGGHFVDRHREELIERVTVVPLNQLRGCPLDEEQYEALLNCTAEKMQMEALFQMVQKWTRQQKDQLYRALAETNPDVIKVLEEEHFIETHQEELTHRASRVDAILRRLPAQHSLIKEGSDQQKMEQLYTLVPNWIRKEKDHLYMVLKKTNGPLVEELKEGHFVERHKEELIQNVTKVKTVAQSLVHCKISRRLYVNLLEKDTDKEKMEVLYKVVPDWTGEWKNRLYQELRATNELLIKELEGRRSSQEGLVPDPLAEEKCYLCKKEKGVPEVQPELIPDAKGDLKIYRIHLPRAGTFLCSVTELKFEVRAAVSLEYTFSSWDEHLSEAEMQTWMVAGPLFDIHADPGGEVAAVHLPHFICLQEGRIDISEMKIAHIVDAGMTLEKPSRVTQFHAVLENPEFSVLGVLLTPLQKFIPVHSVVLLYKTTRKTTTLHLYLVPNDSAVRKAIEDREKIQRAALVNKHPQTDEPLYYGSRYVVISSAEILIDPTELEFSYKTPGQLQSFVDVYLGKTERVNLSVKKKEDLLSVWAAWLESEDVLIQEERRASVTETEEGKRGDLDRSFQALSLGGPCESNTQTGGTPVSSAAEGTQTTLSAESHFIELHREQLIERTVTVEGVLDLLYGVVLNEEQYQRVSLQGTNVDKMRELYRLLPSWNRSCKDRLYEALRKKNPHLIADLEGR